MPSFRYIDETLKDKDTITEGLFCDILQHVGNNRKQSPTVYSNVYDLIAGKVYIYNYYNFNEVLVIDVKKELAKGYRFYNLPELFSRIKAKYPNSGAIINSSSVEFKWAGDATNYEIWLSTDDQFTNPQVMNYSKSQSQKAGFGVIYSMIIILILMFSVRKNRNVILLGAFSLLLFSSCQKTELPGTLSNIEHIKIINDLKPNTKYYWKVVANNSNGFDIETKVESFTTSNF